MPFHSNTTQNTVIYSSPTWETKVIENDITLGDTISETAGIIEPFNIALGKYERIIGEVNLFYSSDNNNEFQFRFQNVDSANAYVDTTFKYSFIGFLKEIAEGAAAETTHALEGGVAVDTTTGQGTEIHLDAGDNNSPLSATIKFSALGGEGKNGTVSFQASNLSAQTGAAVILAGSWLTYKRF